MKQDRRPCWLKPQFEAARASRSATKGVVTDRAVHREVIEH